MPRRILAPMLEVGFAAFWQIVSPCRFECGARRFKGRRGAVALMSRFMVTKVNWDNTLVDELVEVFEACSSIMEGQPWAWVLTFHVVRVRAGAEVDASPRLAFMLSIKI